MSRIANLRGQLMRSRDPGERRVLSKRIHRLEIGFFASMAEEFSPHIEHRLNRENVTLQLLRPRGVR